MIKTFQTTVTGLGPFCIEFSDGEIITTRTLERQRLIAAAPELLEALEACLYFMEDITKECSITDPVNESKARAAIAKAKGE